MPSYEVYATRWDDPHIVEQIPASGLEFSLPLNEHGEASFSATVEPGRSFWRPAIAPLVSGVMICRDNVPVWSGLVWSERQTGARTFEFQCAEWGSFFERIPVPSGAFLGVPTVSLPRVYKGANDHFIFRDIIDAAQAIAGQDVQVLTGSTLGAAYSDFTRQPWDDITVERAFRQIGDAKDGPDWYFAAGGTLENPTRQLVLGDRLGLSEASTVLEYVEDTESYTPPAGIPTVTLLGNLFPGQQPQAVVGRRGGNVIAHPARVRDGSTSATATIAIGSGEERAQKRAYATSGLIDRGYPKLTTSTAYSDVTVAATLQRHADGDLDAAEGLTTGYTFTTFDDEPDWTQVPRGSTVRAVVDTDVYAGDRPLVFEPRLLDVAVQVSDSGPAQVNWTVATVLEV